MEFLIVFVVGLLAASGVNLATCRLRYDPLGYSPWNGLANGIASLLGVREIPVIPKQDLKEKKRRDKKSKKKADEIAKRTWVDLIPILGWMRIKREESLHGRGFWIRPMWVEILLPVSLMLLYWWQVIAQGTIANANGFPFGPLAAAVVEPMFVGSALLILFMLVASLIDLDEYEIPDAVIIPGTILGVIWSAAAAGTPLNQVVGPPRLPLIRMEFIGFSEPNPWPSVLSQQSVFGLLIGIGCVCLWCFALMHRTWRMSRGFKFACWLFCARLRKSPATRLLILLAIIGSAAVGTMWSLVGVEVWQALMTSLLGMIVGAVIIWTVRVVAALTIRREAMGFGDVTLMGMIGAYLGWQACVFVFFIAPFFALIPALASAFSRRTTLHPIPYGPFLCLAAVAVIVFWRAIWEWGELMFAIGWFLPAVLLLCIPVLAGLLGLWRFVRYMLTRNQG